MKVERLVGGSREGAPAAGGETPTKGPDPLGPALRLATGCGPGPVGSRHLRVRIAARRRHGADKGLAPGTSPSVTSTAPGPELPPAETCGGERGTGSILPSARGEQGDAGPSKRFPIESPSPLESCPCPAELLCRARSWGN